MRTRVGEVLLGWDEQGDGPALVLLHAFPLDRRMWRPVVRDLGRRARVLTLDFRGLGESSTGPSGIPTVDEAADDVAALLTRLDIERAVVAGVSMGGYVALAFARRHPERLAGLLLADTRAGADSPEGRTGRDHGIARIAAEGVQGFLHDFVPRLVAARSAKVADLCLAIAGTQSPTGVAGALAALRDRPDARAQLAGIRVPTVVMVGAEDRITPVEEAQALAEAIPAARLVVVPGVGHLSPIEAPEPFADAAFSLIGAKV